MYFKTVYLTDLGLGLGLGLGFLWKREGDGFKTQTLSMKFGILSLYQFWKFVIKDTLLIISLEKKKR